MYKVSITTESVSASFALCRSIEEAIQLALAVHSASNIPHVIGVFSASDACILSLVKETGDAK